MRSPSCFGWRDGTHCAEASRLTEHKLLDVRAKLADLAHMEFVLSQCRLVCACDARTVCLSVRFFPFRELPPSYAELARFAADWATCSMPLKSRSSSSMVAEGASAMRAPVSTDCRSRDALPGATLPVMFR